MPETGNSIINWLVADFHFFGYIGQNWMPALFATAILIYAIVALSSHGHNGPSRHL